MAALWDLWLMVFAALPQFFLEPLYLAIIAVVLYLVYSQFQRLRMMEARLFGLIRETPLRSTLRAVGYGVLAGVAATMVFVVLGISLSGAGVLYLWFVALLLMLIHPRLLCFSYAAGVIGLSHLLLGFPVIDVAAVMALVAVLHLVEAFLIAVQGGDNPMPVYVKQGSGPVVGGFTMQKFWPLPFAALLAVAVAGNAVDFETLTMPDWWPLLQSNLDVPADHSLVYMIFPLIAALGYGDMAVTVSPAAKARESAVQLLIFSGVLLVLALAASRFPAWSWAAVVFAPLGHEWLIYRGQTRERERAPVFTSDHGVMVLDVYPNSPAAAMKLRPGDVLRRFNGRKIATPNDLLEEMTPWVIDPVLEVENVVANEAVRTVRYRGKMPPIGIIPVPDPQQAGYIPMNDGTAISWLLKQWTRRKG